MVFSEFLLAIIWDPDRNLFVFPYIHHPVTWYGFLFALGFFCGYFLTRKIFTRFLADPAKTEAQIQLEAIQATDRLTVVVTLGTLIGARLGHVFFYSWKYYSAHPLSIFKIWEGGLASHGAVIGVLISLLFFVWLSKKSQPKITLLAVLDILAVSAPLAGGFIRIGNFINQEITGNPTSLPWAVSFLHPMDGIPGIPVHPVQLYESLFYFAVFFLLFYLWRRMPRPVGTGLLSGWCLFLIFSFRFWIEDLKVPQNEFFDLEGGIRMGQLLSLPLVLFGLLLLGYHYFYAQKRR